MHIIIKYNTLDVYISFFCLLLCSPVSLFFKQEMELSLVGLQNAGKTSLVNAIAVSEHQTFSHCSVCVGVISDFMILIDIVFLSDGRL